MSTIRVIAGSLKGRRIPFDNRKFNNAEITPQKVKEALFSSLGDRLRGAVFLDLYGGSGQISLEALSRGAGEVITAEPDTRRFYFMQQLSSSMAEGFPWRLLHLRDKKALAVLREETRQIDIIFCDPPYEKEKGHVDLYSRILGLIEESGLLQPGGMVVMQHFSKNSLDDHAGKFTLTRSHTYGNTALTFYKNVTEE